MNLDPGPRALKSVTGTHLDSQSKAKFVFTLRTSQHLTPPLPLPPGYTTFRGDRQRSLLSMFMKYLFLNLSKIWNSTRSSTPWDVILNYQFSAEIDWAVIPCEFCHLGLCIFISMVYICICICTLGVFCTHRDRILVLWFYPDVICPVRSGNGRVLSKQGTLI